MKKSRSTRSHFTHARSCSRALNQVPTRAKQPASIRTYSLWKGDIFSFDRFTGYTKSNQNQFGRVLPSAFALTCYKIYLFFSSLPDFNSFSWRVHLSYGVCRLRARVQLKTLSSLPSFTWITFSAFSYSCASARYFKWHARVCNQARVLILTNFLTVFSLCPEERSIAKTSVRYHS